MSRHKRHLKTLKKLYEAGWFIVMAKPAFHIGVTDNSQHVAVNVK